MKDIEVKEVIISNLLARGEGVKHSPIRRITQVFEKDGTLIAENDPMPDSFAFMDLIHFANFLNGKPQTFKIIDSSHVFQWLDSIENKYPFDSWNKH